MRTATKPLVHLPRDSAIAQYGGEARLEGDGVAPNKWKECGMETTIKTERFAWYKRWIDVKSSGPFI